MLKKNISSLTARKLRLILMGTIVLLILIGAGAFWLLYGKLVAYSDTVKRASAEASLSNENLAALRRLETKLKANERAIERTKNIVADSQAYQYQDQIMNDLNTYAKKAGISITSFTFSEGAAAGAAAATPAASGTAGAAPQPAAAPVAGGLKSTTVSVALSGGASYQSIMRLIHSIERNLTKMQLSGVTLNKEAGSDQVKVDTLTVEVYVR